MVFSNINDSVNKKNTEYPYCIVSVLLNKFYSKLSPVVVSVKLPLTLDRLLIFFFFSGCQIWASVFEELAFS